MAVNLSPIGNGFQFFDTNGVPLNAGKIYTYQAGSSTPLATYSDNAGLVANANPIILGTDGRPPNEVWLTDGYFYKFILKDSSDVTIQTYDNLYGIIGTIPASSGTTIPAGAIMLWSGSIGSIPAGWYLCNGSNGTPDLRDRFVVGAGSTYAVDATGGSADAITVSHTHTVTSTGTSGAAGSHTHGAWSNVSGSSSDSYTFAHPAGSDSVAATNYVSNGYRETLNAAGQNAFSTAPDHTHSLSVTGTTASAGTSGTNANLPPYYALCYIMKS